MIKDDQFKKNNKKILSVSNLNKYFVKSGSLVKVLDNINFDIYENDFFGVIGESGSGKSTVGKCIIRLYPTSGGTIIFDDKLINQKNITKKTKKWLCNNMQMIFQDPMSSLNPKKTVLSLIAEPLLINGTLSKETKDIIKESIRINPFFGNTFKWQDYNLSNKYLLPFYRNMIDIFKSTILKINNFDFSLYNDEKEKNHILKSIFSDLEVSIKKEIEQTSIYTNKIKQLIRKNAEKFDSRFSNEIEINYYEDKKNLKNSLKHKDSPKEFFDLKKKKKEVVEELNEMNETIKIKYKEQNFSLLKSLILSYEIEIKSLKQRKSITTELSEYIFLKTKQLILLDSLKIFKQISSYHFLESDYIKEYSDFIQIRNNNKYKNILSMVSELEKIGNEIDNMDVSNMQKSDIDLILNKYDVLYIEINKNLEVLEKDDINDIDSKIKNSTKKMKDISIEQENSINKSIDDANKLIHDIQNKMNDVQNKYLNSEEKKENLEIYNEALKKYEKSKKIYLDFIKEDNNYFNTECIPLIKKQKKEIYELEKELKLYKNEFRKVINKKIKLISNDQNKLHKKTSNIDFKNKKLNLKSLNFEFETQMEEVTLYRILRSKNKFIIWSNYKYIKMIITREKIYKSLEDVGLKNEHAYRYPHEFSGGQRQRIVIARSLITKPKLIIADEPISALDVSIQAQVINIMKDLADKQGITFLFIAHDLSMVNYTCNRLIIMHKGRIVEKGITSEVFSNPIHPYTISLIKASPELSKINVDLASFSNKINYDSKYGPNNMPEFLSVNDNDDHQVFATRDQFEKWIRK